MEINFQCNSFIQCKEVYYILYIQSLMKYNSLYLYIQFYKKEMP